jgi:hypothetical protein
VRGKQLDSAGAPSQRHRSRPGLEGEGLLESSWSPAGLPPSELSGTRRALYQVGGHRPSRDFRDFFADAPGAIRKMQGTRGWLSQRDRRAWPALRAEIKPVGRHVGAAFKCESQSGGSARVVNQWNWDFLRNSFHPHAHNSCRATTGCGSVCPHAPYGVVYWWDIRRVFPGCSPVIHK